MITLAAKQRSRLAIAAVVALTGLFLAASVVPLAAKDGIADRRARYSACVAAAAGPAQFGDMAGSFAEDEATCLAHYGITKGTSRGVFSPNASITRLQMALFMARAAGAAGIVLPVPSDQGFTDIDSMTGEIRDAMNQVAELGIMTPRSPGLFSPSDVVTRQDMALHLAAFLDAAVVGPGGTAIRGLDPDDSVFQDIETVPYLAYVAIRNLYELGVTVGTSAGTFSPDAVLNRGQMAVFIARMLAHTNARPAGLSIQVDSSDVFRGEDIEMVVSLRSPRHRPLVDRYVDVFTAEERSKAFNSEGACTRDVDHLGGNDACDIDIRDELTNYRGNVVVPEQFTNTDLVVWAWTGDVGDTFDRDSTEAAVIDVAAADLAAAIEISDDMNSTAELLHFGDSVTFTLQLVDNDGDPVTQEGVEVRIYTREIDGNRKSTTSRDTYQTDASGRVRVTYRQDDPSSEVGHTANLDIDFRADLKFEDKTTRGVVMYDDIPDRADRRVNWSDEEAKATILELSQSRGYSEASDDDDGVAHTVRAYLTDQYGDPIVGERILFSSNDPRGVPDGRARHTNSRGIASLSYERDSKGDRIERIRAETDDGRLSAIDLRHYWASPVEDGDESSAGIRVVDTANNVVVVTSGDEILIIKYDSNDWFFVNKKAVSFTDFEDALDEGDALAFEITNDDPRYVNIFRLTNP